MKVWVFACGAIGFLFVYGVGLFPFLFVCAALCLSFYGIGICLSWLPAWRLFVWVFMALAFP
jgi:hypothetical protein